MPHDNRFVVRLPVALNSAPALRTRGPPRLIILIPCKGMIIYRRGMMPYGDKSPLSHRGRCCYAISST